MLSLVKIFAEPQLIHDYGGGKPNKINLNQTFFLSYIFAIHAYCKTYILICFIQLAKRQEKQRVSFGEVPPYSPYFQSSASKANVIASSR